MTTGILLFILLLFGVFFVIYKRHMLVKMFSLNIGALAAEFSSEMELTADKAVKKLEHQVAQLEYLLEEADAKIAILEQRLNQAETIVNKLPTDVKPESSAISPVTRLDLSIPVEISKHDQAPLHQESQSQAPMTPLTDGLPPATQDRRQQVIAMYRQGYNVVEIAKATSMGKGEVMLLLELHKN